MELMSEVEMHIHFQPRLARDAEWHIVACSTSAVVSAVGLSEVTRADVTKVKGFIIEQIKGCYLVAMAGLITFIPFHPLKSERIWNDQFTIESINPGSTNIVVF